ncbi:probable proline--tRNA ligase, mitochondrial [Oscarella lobularis]|uniref:probable proline--tRNA ligase, mitochondrial n=1 Tax=Oscarella lobularis TaxID=121494 RepID=UPI0033132969
MSRFRNVTSRLCALTASSAASGSIKSQRLMLRAGLVRQTASGLYALLPLGLRAMRKLERLVDDEMARIGGAKLAMASLIPKRLWSKSGRWAAYGDELWRVEDRKGSEFCLGPTHEEVIADLASVVRSYRALPLLAYQITRKFRDELRPRGGLLRAREFVMKDMYSFDISPEAAAITYERVNDAYEMIFSRLGVPFVKAKGDTGQIGGSLSHEYHVLASCGEDNVLTCDKCAVSVNEELMNDSVVPRGCKVPKQCEVKTMKGIEVGHAFYLGKKYSDVFQIIVNDSKGGQVTAEMGCYGIGITRLLQACIEAFSPDENQIRWPEQIAPYRVCILPAEKDLHAEAEELYDALVHPSTPYSDIDIILEDRDHLSLSARLSLARLLGYPYLVILGKQMRETGLLELQAQAMEQTEYLSKEKLIDKMLV